MISEEKNSLNIDAEPFYPNAEERNLIEKKRIVAQMYCYYNYLLLDANRDNLM